MWMTKEEATKKINSYIEQNNEFELLYNNEFILVNKETLGVDYKVDELVDRAYSIGRDKDLITDHSLYFTCGISDCDYAAHDGKTGLHAVDGTLLCAPWTA